MTAQILSSELANLIQDSKRKNTELRNASEKALQDLKALPATSETQLAAGLEIQLKILQALPSLLQNYSNELRGELLSLSLQVCSFLQTVKNPAVGNTAAATLQQLVISVFDKVASEDDRSLEIPTIAEVPAGDTSATVRPAAHDAYKMFRDLCLVTEGGKAEFIRFSSLSQTSGLELIESVLTNHGTIFSSHPEQGHTLRSLLMPFIIRSLSDRLTFPIALRVIRILYVLIRNHLAVMPSECEIALGLLNHMLDPEASPPWKRALCMEVFRGLYSDPNLILQIYGEYDGSNGKKIILRDNLAAFVRLSTEKPAAIGLGHHSTAPVTLNNKDAQADQAVVESSIAGVIAGPSNNNAAPTGIGISIQWSSIRTPCLDNLDKSEAPNLPETYIYSLVLTCINNLSESLAKFILPLTVHTESKAKKKAKAQEVSPQDNGSPAPSGLSRTQSYRKRTVPINPLDLEKHSAYTRIKTAADLINECWPAVLATCSTFLHAALDTDYYRALVRSIQKFTQVAGLLRLSTPRDAFLTTLGKAAVPSHVLTANLASPKTPALESPSIFSNPKGLLSVDSFVSQSSTLSQDRSRGTSMDAMNPQLTTRNLLCLRALLNLAIALGPTLGDSWSIAFETLQQADIVMAASNTKGGARNDGETSAQSLGSEIAAVQSAASRLFESTADYPNDSFVQVLDSLCSLLRGKSLPASTPRASSGSFGTPIHHQRRVGSISGISLNTESDARDYVFALNKIADLVVLNESRLAHYEATESGWEIMIKELVSTCINCSIASSARLLAADIIARTVKDIAGLSMMEAEGQNSDVQDRLLSALQYQISALYEDQPEDEDSIDETDVEVHHIALEALKSVMEQCGESLTAGWDSVFVVLKSAFETRHSKHNETDSHKSNGRSTDLSLQPSRVRSKRLARSAFGSAHLVCSDFLATVPDSSISTLLELLILFCAQQDDLNMSLTTITFFWNVSDFLHNRIDMSALPRQHAGEDVRHDIEEASNQGSLPALWIQVLLYLIAVTTDDRMEVRNGAVQTILRIFDNYVDQMSPETWMFCLRVVLFRMIEANLNVQLSLRSLERGPDSEIIASWNDTTKVILRAMTSLFTTYLDTVESSADFGNAWGTILQFFERYYTCRSHSLGASIFTAITGVLSKSEDLNKIGVPALLQTASLWRKYFDHRGLWRAEGDSTQDAFVAYAQAFKEIYRLSKDAIEAEQVLGMITNLEDSVLLSEKIAYSSDVDYMTPLQTQVTECIALVRSDITGAPSFLIKLLSRFVALPFTKTSPDSGQKGPTFVALSKAAMSLLQAIAIKHISLEEVFTSGALDFALVSLVKPIQEKYIWQLEGKSPPAWQKATSTALAILEPALPQSRAFSLTKETTRNIWDQVIHLASAIARAAISSAPPTTNFSKDEQFDIAAFKSLRDMITPALGSPSIPDTTRRAYTAHLFTNSLVHATGPGEIPPPGTGPLTDLYKPRYGRTADPLLTLRSAMAYVCLAELVSLVSIHSSSVEEVKLAQAAAPYLILRAALPLKAYIADQPLRGRMPQPESQRRELLEVVRAMRGMECEPRAIPDAEGVSAPMKKHLVRLFPLVCSAVRVARGDREVSGELVGLVEGVGEEFGV
ncbi:uncharacterized protein BDZ99DRAFT_438522 [Mytilinidion resinicola]|uniref:Endosomal peripheral membrane protein-like protein n=1 Tax=Mytilinidion resinicola TaxID=574789 RepID=A0A6A6YY29_9PEZI|nr:uncharacterized protein BDZ99DRAFT_438522 [Mytilinidion resinicola]KAF2813399.1 hypothetical protein BDZ99DRAFT_438522 [Mytilinidion resinicola]